MKLEYFISVFFFISIVISGCESASIRPRPEGPGWVECIKCRGYGYIYAVKSSGSDHKSSGNPEDKKDYDNSVRWYYDDNKHHQIAEHEGWTAGDDNSGNIENSGDSGRRARKVRCSLCNGVGWMNLQNPETKKLYDSIYPDGNKK